MGCSLPDPSVHSDSLGKNTGVGCHALLQGIFPTQGSNPGLLQYRNKQKISQDKETEEYVPIERKRQDLRKEMERSNLLDKEFKAMVIKVMIYWTQENR